MSNVIDDDKLWGDLSHDPLHSLLRGPFAVRGFSRDILEEFIHPKNR